MKYLKNCSANKVLPYLFNSATGIGLVVTNSEGVEYTVTNRQKTREAQLQVSTWRGISSNAVHYYGKIKVSDLALEFDNNGRRCNTFICNEFLKHEILGTLEFEIELKRKLTKRDFELHPNRFQSYEVGDYVNCFNTSDEVVTLGTKIFLERFVGDWTLFIKRNYGRTITKVKSVKKIIW